MFPLGSRQFQTGCLVERVGDILRTWRCRTVFERSHPFDLEIV
jgi:hypothetical protein